MITAALFGFVFVTPAYAYLDPGTGSILLQSLIASFLAVAAAGSLFWHRIKSFISGLFRRNKSRKSGSDHESE